MLSDKFLLNEHRGRQRQGRLQDKKHANSVKYLTKFTLLDTEQILGFSVAHVGKTTANKNERMHEGMPFLMLCGILVWVPPSLKD